MSVAYNIRAMGMVIYLFLVHLRKLGRDWRLSTNDLVLSTPLRTRGAVHVSSRDQKSFDTTSK
jgi:hypothetical protein